MWATMTRYSVSWNDTRQLVAADQYGTLGNGFICSSPAIGYNVDGERSRWIYVVSREGTGTLYAYQVAP